MNRQIKTRQREGDEGKKERKGSMSEKGNTFIEERVVLLLSRIDPSLKGFLARALLRALSAI